MGNYIKANYIQNSSLSKLGHYVFECSDIQDYEKNHFLSSIIHFLLPRVNYFSQLIVANNVKTGIFQIFLYRGNGDFDLLFREPAEDVQTNEQLNFLPVEYQTPRLDEEEKINLMYNEFPIQLEICPFLVANFETYHLEREFVSKKENEEINRKLIEEKIKLVSERKKYSYIFQSNILNQLSKKREQLLKDDFRQKTRNKLFCDIRLKIHFNLTIIFRVYYAGEESHKDFVNLLTIDESFEKEEKLICRLTQDKDYLWHSNKIVKRIKYFDFPMRQKIHCTFEGGL